MSTEPDCIKLLGEHRRGETLTVGGHRFVDFVSHGTLLEDCTLIIRGAARGVVFHGATFRRCVIQAKRPFTNFSWHDVRLEQCVFQCSLIGCDFGPRPDAYPDHPQGVVTACDFSQAPLHRCRFFRCDMAGQTLPPWPCFTVLEPEQHAALQRPGDDPPQNPVRPDIQTRRVVWELGQDASGDHSLLRVIQETIRQPEDQRDR